MKYYRLFMMIVCMAITLVNAEAEECFSLKQSCLEKVSIGSELLFDSNYAFKPFLDRSPIGGLSISGTITKRSTDYLVRVLLKGTDGRKRLVLESYETINPNSATIQFENYCEETALLDGIIPDSLIVIVKDATLQISDIFVCQQSRSFSKDIQRQQRMSQISIIVDRINANNISQGKLWRAGETELSMLGYEERNALLGISDNCSSGGLEYYIGGIYDTGIPDNTRQANEASEYPDSLDWRNRHGKNWMTSIKEQFGPTCTIYATNGCIEALTNLFYNKKINLDLSEYELVCCADSYPHNLSDPYCEGFDYLTTLEYAKNHGIFNESSYPFVYPNPYVCRSDSIIPNELVKIGGYHIISNNEPDTIKRILSERGPICFEYVYSNTNGHAMVLVGYNTIKVGDIIRYYDSQHNSNIIDTICANSPYIGKTYWILKNSWGTFFQENGGYMYLLYMNDSDFKNKTYEIYLQMPITTLTYTEADIVVEDEDGDGYYFWGLGPKPSFVPSWIPNILDCNDSDPSTAIFGTQINQNTCGDINITDGTIIHSSNTECNTIHVGSGTVTCTGSIYFVSNAQLTMHLNGTFVLDGGVVANAHPYHYTGSKMVIKNGGTVYLKKGQDYYVPLGCELELTEGEIRGPYKKE
jgi:hypothetical protein